MLTYTQTSTVTATETSTLTQTTLIPSASPSSPPSTELKFVLHSETRPGYPVVVIDGRLAYGNLSSNPQTLRLSQSQLYDVSGNITYISRSDLTSQDRSYLYLVLPSTVPADGVTDVFSLDGQKNLVVTVDGTTLIAVICGNDNFIRFGYSAGSCEAVVLGPEYTVPTSSAPLSKPTSAPSSAPSYPPSASSVPPAISSTPTSDSPSSAPSSSPSSAPPAPVPTFALLVASPDPNVINQGNATLVEANDTSVISFTAYDQFNNTLPYANFTLTCDNWLETNCVFSLSEDGEPVTEVMTNENGTLEVYFSSIQAGSKCVRIFDERDQAAVFPINVTAVINCDNFTIAMSNITDPAYSLIFGLDYPILNASVLDLNNDPISGANVTFEMLYLAGRKRTPATFVETTDSNGKATHDVGLWGQGGPYQWTVTTGNCSALNYDPITWYYGVNCSVSTYNFPNNTWTDEVLTISGNYQPNTGASLVGASLYLELLNPDPTTMIIPVQDDGHWSQNITYSGSSLSWPASLSFTGSSAPCSYDTTITWAVKMPSCTNPGVFTITPDDPAVDASISVTIQSMDAFGSPLPNVPWFIYSSTQGESAWSSSGVTDDNGQDSLLIGNEGFGTGSDTLVLVLDNGTPNSCSTSSEIYWGYTPP